MFAPTAGDEAQKAVMPAVQVNAWHAADGGQGEGVAGHGRHSASPELLVALDAGATSWIRARSSARSDLVGGAALDGVRPRDRDRRRWRMDRFDARWARRCTRRPVSCRASFGATARRAGRRARVARMAQAPRVGLRGHDRTRTAPSSLSRRALAMLALALRLRARPRRPRLPFCARHRRSSSRSFMCPFRARAKRRMARRIAAAVLTARSSRTAVIVLVFEQLFLVRLP